MNYDCMSRYERMVTFKSYGWTFSCRLASKIFVTDVF